MILCSPDTPFSLLNYIQTGGVVALLLIVVFGGYKKWWVFGWYYRELRERNDKVVEEKDNWKELALRSTNLAESLDQMAKSRILP